MKESGDITRPLRDPNNVQVIKKLPATTRRGRRPITIYTLTLGVSLILLIAQLCLIAFSVKSIAQGSSNKNNLQQRQPKVSWEPCNNQSTLCPVFENDNVGTLLKVVSIRLCCFVNTLNTCIYNNIVINNLTKRSVVVIS